MSFTSFQFVSERIVPSLQYLMNDTNEQPIQNCSLAVKAIFFLRRSLGKKNRRERRRTK